MPDDDSDIQADNSAAGPAARAQPPQNYDAEHLQRLSDALEHFVDPGTLAGILPGVGTPEQVGPYTILELIGEGGMGSVFKAEQRRPVRRVVALKLVKPGLDTRVVLVRFEAERQALARMDHANIAKVLDAGADHFGRPYFVMEYVAGKPITQFADQHKLSIRDRLDLFCKVCDAIAHAHTKAILHRDIKASNVLAYMNDGRASIKVIDFGVAKAITGDRLTEVSFSTDRGVLVGTYDSMSPEQADGSPDIDTRTDVYSLGVLLYELLAGVKPFDKEQLTQANDQELRRIIREQEAPRPSARFGSLHAEERERIADARQTRAEALARQLRGELEWIPLMALRKPRERRYSSPSALADDVRDYLAGKPLVAGPESRAYIARKFLRRHRAAVVGTVALLVLSVSAVSFYLHRIRAEQKRTLSALHQAEEQTRLAEAQARRAEEQTKWAEYQMSVANNTKDFLGDMLRSTNPRKALGKPVLVIDVLREAVQRVEKQFKDQPAVEAQLHTTLGDSLMALGETGDALAQYERALEIRRKLWGPEATLSIVSEGLVGKAQMDLGRTREAEENLRNALARCRKYFGADHVEMLRAETNLGMLLTRIGKYDEAEPLLREAYEQRLKKFGSDSIESLQSATRWANALKMLGRLDEAEAIYRDALERSKRVMGEQDYFVSSIQNSLSLLLSQAGRLEEAETMLRAVLDYNRRVMPPGHPDLVIVTYNLASLLSKRGRAAEAEPLAREAYEESARSLGADDLRTLRHQHMLRRIMTENGHVKESIPVARDLIERRMRVNGPDHADTREAIRGLAASLMRAMQYDEVISVLYDLIDICTRVAGEHGKETLQARNDLAGVLRELNRHAEAEDEYARLISGAERNPSAVSTAELARYRAMRALSVKDDGRLDEAKPLLQEALVALRAANQGNNATSRMCVRALADIAENTGDQEEAARLQREIDRMVAATRPASQPTSRRTGYLG